MKKILMWLVCLLSFTIAQAKEPITVVTSFSILGDLTRNIGQGRVKVINLVEAGKDIHTFQPSPADVKKLTAARLVLTNGLGLEGWITRMVSASGYKNPIVPIAEKLPSLLKEAHHHHDHHHHHHHHGHYDPHVWQDPVLMKQYVRNIADALTQVDPEGDAVYAANAQAYTAKLEALHTWAEKILAPIAVAQRRVITSHEAFAYLGRRYHIEFMALQGNSTESEASAKDLARLVQQVRQMKVQALFVENISHPRLIETLALEAKVRVGGRLYSDALAKSGPASTYLGMYRYNIETLLAGLQ